MSNKWLEATLDRVLISDGFEPCTDTLSLCVGLQIGRAPHIARNDCAVWNSKRLEPLYLQIPKMLEHCCSLGEVVHPLYLRNRPTLVYMGVLLAVSP